MNGQTKRQRDRQGDRQTLIEELIQACKTKGEGTKDRWNAVR